MRILLTTQLRLLAAFAALLAAQSLHAADAPMRVWASDLCRNANNHLLLITKTDGKRLKGYCVVDNSQDNLQLRRGHHTEVIEFSELKSVRMRRKSGRHLEGLGECVRDLLLTEAICIPSPVMPLAIAAIPVTLVGGAGFAAVGGVRNLIALLSGTREIILQP